MPSAALKRLAQKANATLALANSPAFPLRADIARAPALQDALEDVRALSISVSYYFLLPRDTFYIAFVGHYSAGKSSTINSLLGTERDADVNPTDRRLTFVSSEANTGPILETIRTETTQVGAFIDVQTVASDFTRNLVVIDTPGGGDPRIDRTLIQNFLPVCDAIAYFTSGAAPFNTTDKDVLRPYLDELHFIPMIFVVTRADEFRPDKSRPLTAENYRADRAEAAVAVAKDRLRDDFELPGIEEKPHILIDNVAGFGVDALREAVRGLRGGHTSREPQVVAHFEKRLDRGLERIIDHVETVSACCATLFEKFEGDHALYEERSRRPDAALQEVLDASAAAIAEHRRGVAERWPSEAALAVVAAPTRLEEDASDRDRVEYVWEKRREFLQRGGFLIDQIFRRFSQEFERDVSNAMLARCGPDRPLPTDLGFEEAFDRSFDNAEALIAREFRLLWNEFRQAFVDYVRSDGEFSAARIAARRGEIDATQAAVRAEAASPAALALEEQTARELRSAADRAAKDFFILAQSFNAEIVAFKAQTLGDSVALADIVEAIDELGLDADGVAALTEAAFPSAAPERQAARRRFQETAAAAQAFQLSSDAGDAGAAFADAVAPIDVDGRLDEVADAIVGDAATLARVTLQKRLDAAAAVEREVETTAERLAAEARKRADATIGWARHVANAALLSVAALVVYLVNGGFGDILLPLGVGAVALGAANHFAIGAVAKRTPQAEALASAQDEIDAAARGLREAFVQSLRSGDAEHYLRGREAASRIAGRLETLATAAADEAAGLRAPEEARQAQALDADGAAVADMARRFKEEWERFVAFVASSSGDPANAKRRIAALGETIKERAMTRRLAALCERRDQIDEGLAALKRIRMIR